MTILLTEASDAEITAELERRARAEVVAEQARNTAWNKENAQILLAITKHNPEQMSVRPKGGHWGDGSARDKVYCSDENPCCPIGRCARCGVLRMIASEEWDQYKFDLAVEGRYLDYFEPIARR